MIQQNNIAFNHSMRVSARTPSHVCLLLNGTSALFRLLVPRIVEIEHNIVRHAKKDFRLTIII